METSYLKFKVGVALFLLLSLGKLIYNYYLTLVLQLHNRNIKVNLHFLLTNRVIIS